MTTNVLVALCLAVQGVSAFAAAPALIGIQQGSAELVRQTTRYTLVEGTALAEGDIIETGADGFVQIELEDGTIVSMAENGRLLLKPRITNLKTVAVPQFYLLEGWIKLSAAPKAPADFDFLTPTFELATQGATIVARVRPKAYEIFVETGSARLSPRSGTGVVALKSNDFASQAATADKPNVGPSLGAEFLQQLPKAYRDRLPARAAIYANRTIALKPIGPIEYADVTPWMRSESGIRLALSKQWRSRANDRVFRSALAANLSSHMEWERVLYPERFLPKPPPKPTPKPAVATAQPATAPTAAASAASAAN